MQDGQKEVEKCMCVRERERRERERERERGGRRERGERVCERE